MLKKLLIVVPLAILLVPGLLLWQRIEANPQGVLPLPYVFPSGQQKIEVEAPLLIMGDRMAQRFGLFKETLSLEISQGLSKALKTGVLAKENQGMHRTLNQLENLATWPKIIIYTGGSEEFVEDKFLTNQIPTIRKNFERYQDDRWRTLMMLWPETARAIYEPLKKLPLADSVTITTDRTEEEFQSRLELNLKLYEIELRRFVELSRAHDVYLILMTVPVNLDIPPKKTCSFSASAGTTQEISEIRQLIVAQDYKSAYARAKTLSETVIANAEVFYLFGQIANRTANTEEARVALRKAAAFDCQNWRSTEVSNNLIRKIAYEERVPLFDFAAMVEEEWNRNTTFFDEVYPQDLYYEKANKDLAIVLKRILKI